MEEKVVDSTKASTAASRSGHGRGCRGLTKAQRRDVRWMLQQSGSTHGVDVHGVWIKFRQEAEQPSKKPSRRTEGTAASNNSTQQTQRGAANAASKTRIVIYGKAMSFLKGLVVRRWKEAIEQWRRERQQQTQHDETEAAKAAAASAAAAAQINARVQLEKRASDAEAKARRWSERYAECEKEREELRQQLRQLRLVVQQQVGPEQQLSRTARVAAAAAEQQQQSLTMQGEDDRAQKRVHESPNKGAIVPAAESPTATGRAQGAAASTPPIAPKKPRALEGYFEASGADACGTGGGGRGGHSGGRGRGRGGQTA